MRYFSCERIVFWPVAVFFSNTQENCASLKKRWSNNRPETEQSKYKLLTEAKKQEYKKGFIKTNLIFLLLPTGVPDSGQNLAKPEAPAKDQRVASSSMYCRSWTQGDALSKTQALRCFHSHRATKITTELKPFGQLVLKILKTKPYFQLQPINLSLYKLDQPTRLQYQYWSVVSQHYLNFIKYLMLNEKCDKRLACVNAESTFCG